MKLTAEDARYAARKMRELLEYAARLCEIEAQELLCESDMLAAQAGELLRVCNELRR